MGCWWIVIRIMLRNGQNCSKPRKFPSIRKTCLDRFWGNATTMHFDISLDETFRKAFAPHARPLPGLEALIQKLDAANVPMAVASSDMRDNVEFVVKALGFQPFFQILLSAKDVTHPKPHPG